VHRVNLKSDRGAGLEVFEVLGYSNGEDPGIWQGGGAEGAGEGGREGADQERPFGPAGRMVPILASPVVAYLNNRDAARRGAAVRFYGPSGQTPRAAPGSGHLAPAATSP